MSYIKYKPVIYKDGTFYKVKPYIVNAGTNISYKSYIYKISSGGDTPVVESGFITSDNHIFMTVNNEYFVSAGG